MQQLLLDFPTQTDYSVKALLPLASQGAALEYLQKHGRGCAVLHGAVGVGKTHLAKIWAAHYNAAYIPAEIVENIDVLAFNFAAIDDADTLTTCGQEKLFHMYNHVNKAGGALLCVTQKPAKQWANTLPDLQSRLASVPQIEIALPQVAELKLLFVKWLNDRQLEVDVSVVDYVCVRVERSPEKVAQFLHKLDSIALQEKRPITIPLARRVLEMTYST